MAYVGTHLLLSAAVLLLFPLTGRLAARPWTALAARPEERMLLHFTLGVAIWTALLFVLAATGLLTTQAVLTVLAVVLAASFLALRRDRREAGPVQPPEVVASPPSNRLAALAAVVVAVTFAALFLHTLRPVIAWDADVYHLTLPRIYVENGGFVRVPFNVYSHWPSGMQLLYALALILDDFILAKTIHFGFGVVLAIGLGRWIAHRSSPVWGLLGPAALLATPVFQFELATAYVDVAMALFLFSAFVFCRRALESDDAARTTRWMLAAGIACGLMAGAKVNGIAGAGAVGAVFLFSCLRQGRGWRAAARPLLAFAVGLAALTLPWLAKSLWLTGNPLYPLLHGTFGGPEWSESLARAHGAWNRGIGMGRGPLDYLLLLPRVLFLGGEGYEHFDGRLHPLIALLLLAGLLGLKGRPEARGALAVAALWFVAWAATSQQMRFLIPALPLVAAAGALGACDLSRRTGPARVWLERAVVLGVTLVVPLANQPTLRQAPELAGRYAEQGGELHRRPPVPPVYGFVNARLPEAAKLLFVNVNRGFFCERDFLADSFFEASQLAWWLGTLGTREAILGGLRERGITHVLVKREEAGPIFPDAFVELLADPAHRRVYDAEDPSGSYFIVELGTG